MKLSEEADNRHFVLEQHNRRRESEEIKRIDGKETEDNDKITEALPNEIAQMVNEYLKINKGNETSTARTKKPSKKHFSSEIARLPSLDYVYDIYHLEQIPEDEAVTYTREKVGFIKIINKDIELLPESDTDSNLQLSDDEDSNDENYYQNDYPEDEDDDRSVLFGASVEEEQSSDSLEWTKLAEEPRAENEAGTDQLGDYSDIFDKLEGSNDILNSLKSSHVIDLDTTRYYDEVYDDDEEEAEQMMDDKQGEIPSNNDYNDEETYERNNFFPTDIDDPLAQHRDKIFGQLQKMINEG